MRRALIGLLVLGCHRQAAPQETVTYEPISAREVPLPDGTTGYTTECQWPDGCMQFAGVECPSGYEIVAAGPVRVEEPEDTGEPSKGSRLRCAIAGGFANSNGTNPFAGELCMRRIEEQARYEREQAQQAAEFDAQTRQKIVFRCRPSIPNSPAARAPHASVPPAAALPPAASPTAPLGF